MNGIYREPVALIGHGGFKRGGERVTDSLYPLTKKLPEYAKMTDGRLQAVRINPMKNGTEAFTAEGCIN